MTVLTWKFDVQTLIAQILAYEFGPEPVQFMANLSTSIAHDQSTYTVLTYYYFIMKQFEVCALSILTG
jgi:hypothetical protein